MVSQRFLAIGTGELALFRITGPGSPEAAGARGQPPWSRLPGPGPPSTGANWLCFARSVWRLGVLPTRARRARCGQIGFVSHDGPPDGVSSRADPLGPVCWQIGFVLPTSRACSVRHNSFPTKHLSFVSLQEILALFRTSSQAPRHGKPYSPSFLGTCPPEIGFVLHNWPQAGNSVRDLASSGPSLSAEGVSPEGQVARPVPGPAGERAATRGLSCLLMPGPSRSNPPNVVSYLYPLLC
jgi:hypothetical protein